MCDTRKELKKWVRESFPHLSEEEVQEYFEDYCELANWWASVLVEDALSKDDGSVSDLSE